MEYSTKENIMNLKMIKAAWIGLVLSVSGLANATLIDNGSYTTDTEAGLEWLDWTTTSGETQADAIATFGSGGWRIANQTEVYELFNNYFDTTLIYTSENYVNSAGIPDYTNKFTEFKDLFGSNNGTQVFARIEGLGLIGLQSSHIFGGYLPGTYGAINLNRTREGVALVRDSVQVPEPSTFAIFALGMIGLVSRRFKKQS